MTENNLAIQNNSPLTASPEAARQIAEVQAMVFVAKQYPRDIHAATNRILQACQRVNLAEQANYTYPRGNSLVEGPSIRLAEALAQNWGNVQFGVEELSQESGYSKVQTFAWDLETNTRSIKSFNVRHWRDTKKGGYALTDARDIYEMVANQGARRLRACILAILPGDVVSDAVEECRKTLADSEKIPLEKRITLMVATFFKEYQVPQESLEKYLGHNVGSSTDHELFTLRGVIRSLRDGMSNRGDHFDIPEATGAEAGNKPAHKSKGAGKDAKPKTKSAGKAKEDAQDQQASAEGAAQGDQGAQQEPVEFPWGQGSPTDFINHCIDKGHGEAIEGEVMDLTARYNRVLSGEVPDALDNYTAPQGFDELEEKGVWIVESVKAYYQELATAQAGK